MKSFPNTSLHFWWVNALSIRPHAPDIFKASYILVLRWYFSIALQVAQIRPVCYAPFNYLETRPHCGQAQFRQVANDQAKITSSCKKMYRIVVVYFNKAIMLYWQIAIQRIQRNIMLGWKAVGTNVTTWGNGLNGEYVLIREHLVPDIVINKATKGVHICTRVNSG